MKPGLALEQTHPRTRPFLGSARAGERSPVRRAPRAPRPPGPTSRSMEARQACGGVGGVL